MSKPPLLEADHVDIVRGDIALVRGLSLALDAGDLLVVRGANGAGKTSLLRVFAGITPPLAGSVRIAGMAQAQDPASTAQHCAYWGHRDGFRPGLSALDNLREWAALYGKAVPSQIFDAVQLTHKGQTPLRFLSAGQRRRLGLARLLLQEADIWLMDEPFTALDDAGRQTLMRLMKQHLAAGGCAVLALHEPLAGLPHRQLVLGDAANTVAA
ncbi:MAG: heme ABC exporter ATP-binding protein CcmA [Pseudomonadota bacterium]